MSEFTPQADEALALKNIEGILVRIERLLTEVRGLLKKIG